MQYEDKGIILKISKFSEKSGIITCLSENNGVIAGLIKNIYAKNIRADLSYGNIINFTWYGRIKESLGVIKPELLENMAVYYISNFSKLRVLQSLIKLILKTINYEQPDRDLYLLVERFLHKLKNNDELIGEFFLFELNLLTILGYGVDFGLCDITGTRSDKVFVSPRTGNIVSYELAEPYINKMFAVPNFLITGIIENLNQEDLIQADKIIRLYYKKFIHQNLSSYFDFKDDLLKNFLYNLPA